MKRRKIRLQPCCWILLLLVNPMLGMAQSPCPNLQPTPGPGPAQCPITLVQIQGFLPDGGGTLLTQIWVGTDAIVDPTPPQSDFLVAFDGLDVHSLPQHHNPVPSVTRPWPMVGINYTAGSPTESSEIRYDWPVCQGNCSGNGNGNSLGNEQAQQDGLLLLPGFVDCIHFSFSGNTNKAAALYLSSDGTVDSLKQVLAIVTPGSTQLDVNWPIPMGLPQTTSGFRYTRIRLYHHDASNLADTEVKWDIGNGMETIPAAFFHPVFDPHTNGSPPQGTKPANGSFAYQDANGQLFARDGNHLIGDSIRLDLRYHEASITVMTNVHSGAACDTAVCGQREVIRIQRFRPNAAGMVFQKKWTGGNNPSPPGQQGYREAFSNTTTYPPSHPQSIPGQVVTIAPNAAFGLEDPSYNGSLQGTQDVWLVVPPNIKNLRFKLGAQGTTQASALWLGADYQDLREIATEVNGNQVGGCYALPNNLAPASNTGWRYVRARLYVHDDGGAHNSWVQWDLGQGFEYVKSWYLSPCAAADENTPPSSQVPFSYVSTQYGLYLLGQGTIWEPNGYSPLLVPIPLRDYLNERVDTAWLPNCVSQISATIGVDCDSAFAADPCNQYPVAVPDDVVVIENTFTTFSPLDNDYDPDRADSILSLVNVTVGSKGTPSIIGDSISFVCIQNATGNDYITYQICDDGNPPLCVWGDIVLRIRRDSDRDQVADTLDFDNDNDGIRDSIENANARNAGDTDNDGILDIHDLDSDNDGIPDIQEYGLSPTNPTSGKVPLQPNLLLLHDSLNGLVSGSNGWDDFAEFFQNPGLDADGDGIPDFQDLDSDNDGIYDIVESGRGADSDNGVFSLPIQGMDDNGWDERGEYIDTLDLDHDGVLERLDLDSDNDGIPNIVEAGFLDGDGNGMLDAFVDTPDTNGADDGRMVVHSIDADGDGRPSYRDLDADNDGIADIVEDGRMDVSQTGSYGVSILDTMPVDGWVDTLTAPGTFNTDNDSIPNFLDLDSDNDGLYDRDEELTKALSDAGRVVLFADSVWGWDINERIDSLRDSDGDGRWDRLDLDSDNDGISDLVEGGGVDAGLLDGMLDAFADPDGDGADSALMRTAFMMSDRDSLPDQLDLDADNDGIVDFHEGGGTGSHSLAQLDVAPTDADGWTDSIPVRGTIDTDGDAVPDRIDLDSDNDGIYDLHEFAPDAFWKTLDSLPCNGRIDALEQQSDSAWYQPLSLLPFIDTDGDGVRDYRDWDADNDGICDLLEDSLKWSDNSTPNFPIITVHPVSGIYLSGMRLSRHHTDDDGIPDFRDLDSDQDGIADLVEAGYQGSQNGRIPTSQLDSLHGWTQNPLPTVGDQDDDEFPNYLDHDSDNDGIPDVIEGDGIYPQAQGIIMDYHDSIDGLDGWDDAHSGTLPLNTDGLGEPDYLDRDSDEDGLTDRQESREDAYALYPNGDIPPNVLLLDEFGWDDVHGTISPMNTDQKDLADYRDRDADNDSISDALEYRFVLDGNDCNDSDIPAWRNPIPCNILFYEGFSPNGDGLNDEFVVEGIVYQGQANTFTVYNRWGMVVYKDSPWRGSWDGKSNRGFGGDATDAPEGVYYYTLEFGTGFQRGYFYLKR